MRGVVTPEQRYSWEHDGWCVLEEAVPRENLAAAQHAVAKLFPRVDEMAASSDDTGSSDDAGLERWRTWDAAWPEFPFRSRSLNGLVLSELMLALARELLDTDDVRLYLAIATAKYAGHPSDYNQLLHTDFPNHTLTCRGPNRDISRWRRSSTSATSTRTTVPPVSCRAPARSTSRWSNTR